MKKTTVSPKKSSVKAKQQIAVYQTSADLMKAVLIVSLLLNLFVFSIWVVVNVTNDYDQALLQFFFNK